VIDVGTANGKPVQIFLVLMKSNAGNIQKQCILRWTDSDQTEACIFMGVKFFSRRSAQHDLAPNGVFAYSDKRRLIDPKKTAEEIEAYLNCKLGEVNKASIADVVSITEAYRDIHLIDLSGYDCRTVILDEMQAEMEKLVTLMRENKESNQRTINYDIRVFEEEKEKRRREENTPLSLAELIELDRKSKEEGQRFRFVPANSEERICRFKR